MAKETSKSVTMRAFKIKNSDPTKFVSGIRVKLSQILGLYATVL